MKTIASLAFTLIVLAVLSPVNASAQANRNIERVCFYQDINFRGWEQCYSAGNEIANLGGRQNQISSIRVFNGAHVIVYENTNFSGISAEFRSDIADLSRVSGGTRSWSDRIGSVRVSADYNDRGNRGNNGNNRGNIGDNGRGNSGRGIGRGQVRDGICVYENVNYNGYSECWESGQQVRDLGRFGGWNDLISSVRVFGRATAEFYRDIGFGGERIVVDRDVPDLSRYRLSGNQNWNDQASSMSVQSQSARNRNWR